jgi:hypothetical protein
MRSFSMVFGVLVLAAMGASGCSGGPCAEYCAAMQTCLCPLQDPGGTQQRCVEACEAGLDAVEGYRKATEDCLSCAAPRYADGCGLPTDQCQTECSAADPWGWQLVFESELGTQDVPLCADGRPSGGGACEETDSEGFEGHSCAVECVAGDLMAAVECILSTEESSYTCQCTAGPQQGRSFDSLGPCLDLRDLVWDQCR